MKNLHGFLPALMLLSLFGFFSPKVDAQTPKNPQQDLSVEFSANYVGTSDPGMVFGTVTNKSANVYRCVRIEFILGTRYDHARLGEPNRPASVFAVDVQNISPRAVREYRSPLPLPSSVGFKSISECLAASKSQLVVVYDQPNFEGRSKSFGIGRHRLFNEQDFNDFASSIRVPAGFVVAVYEHADQGGGYGRWVDFLEDHRDLSRYNFNNNISFLDVFEIQKTSELPGTTRIKALVYVRNSIQGERFVAGHWANLWDGKPLNPNPVASYKPPNVPVPGFCSISGTIRFDKREYATSVGLYSPDGSGRAQRRAIVINGQYKLERVAEGEYLVVPKGNYPSGEGRSGGLGPMPNSQRVVCQPNGSNQAHFKIVNQEG